MRKFDLILSFILSSFTYITGGFDMLLNTLLIVISIDYITGLCKGIYKKELNSKKGIKGIIKKVGYILIVILATLFDKVIGDNTNAIRTLVIYFFIANEALSILENWALMDLPLPKKLFEIFESLKETNNKKNNKD